MRRVTVSYEAVGGLTEEGNLWDTLKDDVQKQLPLTNLHWKSTSRSIRTIQSLDIEFMSFSLYKDELGSSSFVRLLERPYLHLLFVVCDDNEVYRATVRLQIRYWLDKVLAKQNQEWLIINLTTGRVPGAKFYQRKGSVIDKIRADFNTGKKDRCVQVAQSAPEDLTAWTEFTTRVKEGIIARFDTNIALYEEDVRKADSQRQLPGWNFCSFFSQKEALADCFEAMNLLEDALIQYDELEASFFQTLKDNNNAWAGKIGGADIGDDKLPLLSTKNKPYRELIDTTTISIFDFRIYLFARQGALLIALNRIPEVAKRGAYFISSFARTLRQNQSALGSNFLESWTFSACLHLVDECQLATEAITASDVSPSLGFTAIKAELLELARKQLDKIGISAGHLPSAHPFDMSLQESIPDSQLKSAGQLARPPVSRKDLLDAIADRVAFDKLYVDLTNRSIKAYQSSRRKRCALKLHASLAALEDHRKESTQAQKLYSNLPAHYVELRWAKIEALLLTRCINLQESLTMDKDRLLSTLALVRAGVEFESKIWNLEGFGLEGAELARKLMDDIYTLAGLLTKDFAAIAFPTFSMRLSSERGETALEEDGVIVRLKIKSLLPCVIKVDEVRLKFSTVDGEMVWFTVGACTLLPASETEITLFCPTAVTGRLALELSQIRFSRIIFQYSHRPISTRNLAPDPRFTPHTASQPTIHFPKDRQALDIYLESPRAIHLDQDRQLIVCIATGRNQLVKVTIKLSTIVKEIEFQLEEAKIVHGNAKLVKSLTEESLSIEKVEALSIVKIQIPIQGILNDNALDINVIAEYFSSKRPTTRRTLRRIAHFPIALPLAVTVQDFFRKDCLLSKFSVTTDGVHALRVKSAELLGASNLIVKACRGIDVPDVTILPLQTANFLFKILRSQAMLSQEPLQLTLRYRPIQEELRSMIKSLILQSLSTLSLESSNQWFIDHVLPVIESKINLHWYGISGNLNHLLFSSKDWKEIVEKDFVAEKGESVMAALESVYSKLRSATVEDVPDEWRILTIPVELPSLSILNLVHISTAMDQIEVGTPVATTLSIKPSLSWAQTDHPISLFLCYDITANSDDWLISGRKRGEFVAEDGQESAIQLTLIPLRSGSLFLPSVTVRPIRRDEAEEIISCETQHLSAARSIEVLPVTARTTFNIQLVNDWER